MACLTEEEQQVLFRFDFVSLIFLAKMSTKIWAFILTFLTSFHFEEMRDKFVAMWRLTFLLKQASDSESLTILMTTGGGREGSFQ